MITRRGFMAAILASAAAPAIVRADALMRIVPRDALLVQPPLPQMSAQQYQRVLTMTLQEWQEARHPLGIVSLSRPWQELLNGQCQGWHDAAPLRAGDVITLADSPMRYVVRR